MGRPRKTGQKEKNEPKTKRPRINHDPDVIAQAIEIIKSGRLSQRQAAIAFKIPHSTLNDKIMGKTPLASKKVSLLLPNEEEKLVRFTLDMAKCGFGQTADDIRRKAKAIIDVRKPPEDAAENTNLPSTAWVYRFLERHPQLTLRSTTSLRKVPETMAPQIIYKWFQALKEYVLSIDPSLLEDGSRIYNADESGFDFNINGRKVAAFKGSKYVYNLTSNTKTQVTVLACMNASGHYLPPLMVYPYKRLPQKDLASGFPEAIIQASDNGWMTAAIFYSWLQDCFIPKTKHVKKPLLLLVDGHMSHTSLVETSTLCKENGIILYCFVAHASHLIQPLDQAFFGSIKPAWAKAIRHHSANCGKSVGLENFASVLKPVWDKSTTAEIAAQSFKAAGIVPFDPYRVIKSEKMAPCDVFCTEPSLPIVPSATIPPDKTLSPTAHSAISLTDKAPYTSPLLDETWPPAVHCATSLPEQSMPKSISVASSSSTASIPSSSFSLPTLSLEQLKAIKAFGLFLYDDVLRKEFIRFSTVLTGTETAPQDALFQEFIGHIQKIKGVFSPAAPSEKNPIKASLTKDDILKTPEFCSKSKRAKNLTQTIPHCGEDFSSVVERNRKSKEREERAKFAKSIMREKNRRKRDENIKMMKCKKHFEMMEIQRKKTEEEKRKLQKKEQIKQRKVRRVRTVSSSSEEGKAIESQMLNEMTRCDDEDELMLELEIPSDFCQGCNQEGDGELWLQCEMCVGWWHQRCTKIASLSMEQIEQYKFFCVKCVPNQ